MSVSTQSLQAFLNFELFTVCHIIGTRTQNDSDTYT